MAKKIVSERISRADSNLEAVKFLLENKSPLEDGAWFVPRSIERYLNAFFIFIGCELQKIHDLIKLSKGAVKYDKSFEKFVSAICLLVKGFSN